MQEIKKRRIVIASVLKPVDDTRMFGKIGQSLAKKYEVHIIGFPGVTQPTRQSVFQYPTQNFSRLSLKRVLIPWRFFLLTWKLNPAEVIICTHELIVAAVFLKIFRRIRIFYDVQENYYRNILYTDAFPPIVRPFLAGYVRIKERLSAPYFNKFLLAEKAYLHEMPFLAKKSVVLENKYKSHNQVLPMTSREEGLIQLAFTGTLSRTTGVFTVIDLAERLWQAKPSIRLVLCGYCPRSSEYDEIVQAVTGKPFISLIGGNSLVPHHEIISLIQRSDFGVVAYPPSPATENSIPTKLFEYVANQLPVIVINHPPWVRFLKEYNAAIPFDARSKEVDKIIYEMEKGGFYGLPTTDVYWDTEESKLFEIFK